MSETSGAGSRVTITTDHNGWALKNDIVAWLRERGHDVDDCSPPPSTEAVDYPPLCEKVCRRVVGGTVTFGLIVGGSGQGEQIACNKVRGIRAAPCNEPFTTEIARARNNASVVVIGAKTVQAEQTEKLLAIWFDTAFKGGMHQRRVDQIAILDDGGSLL